MWHTGLGKRIGSSVGTVAPGRIGKPGEISCNQCPSPAECRAPREGEELRYCTDTPFPTLSCFPPPPSNTSLAPAVFPFLTVATAHVPLHSYLSGNFPDLPGLFPARLRRSTLICYLCSACSGFINHNGSHSIRTYTSLSWNCVPDCVLSVVCCEESRNCA